MMIKTWFAVIAMMGMTGAASAERIEVQPKTPVRRTYSLDRATALTLANSVGRVEISEVDGSDLVLEASLSGSKPAFLIVDEASPGQFKVRVEYPTVESGKQSFTQIIGSFVSVGGSVTINGSSITIGDSGVTLKLGVPKTLLAHLDVTTSSGDQRIEGRFAGAEATNRKVSLKSMSGEITCLGLCTTATIDVDASSGDVTMEATESQSTRVRTTSGEQTLTGLIGDLESNSTSGDVEIRGGGGDVRVDATSGEVTVEDRADAERVRVTSSSGDIEIERVSGVLTLRSSSGEIEVTKFSDGPHGIETSSGDIVLSNGAGDVEARSSSGEVRITAHQSGILNVRTSSGDITFRDSAASVSEQASSRSGEVRYSKRAKERHFDMQSPKSESCDEVLKPNRGRIIED